MLLDEASARIRCPSFLVELEDNKLLQKVQEIQHVATPETTMKLRNKMGTVTITGIGDNSLDKASEKSQIHTIIETIAKEELNIPTLDAQWSDDLDFHEVHVSAVKTALLKAFDKGANCMIV